MEQGFFERLTEIMAAMAAGDTEALGALHDEYGDPIRGTVRKELARLGVTHLDAAEVDGLAVDVCAELFRRAKAWSPEHNTLPWTWAKLRVRAIVVAYVGQFTDPLPEGGPPAAAAVAPPAGPADEPVLVTFGPWPPSAVSCAFWKRRCTRSADQPSSRSCSRCVCRPTRATPRPP